MKEINLKYHLLKRSETPRKYAPDRFNSSKFPNLVMEDLLLSIIKRVENKEKVYVKFSDNHEKRPGAIALIYKIDGYPFTSTNYKNSSGETIYNDESSCYTFHLKWDDRNNKTKIKPGDIYNDNDLVYLPEYNGPTVWSLFDADKFAEEHKEKILDRLGNDLSVGDTVVYINARYGTGAYIDFGVIRKFKHNVGQYRGKKTINTEVIIETIALEQGVVVEISKIKQPQRSIMRMTNADLMNEAFLKKLTVPQIKE